MRSSLKCVPHGKLIANVMRTRVHHATRSFFWETCGDGHDAGPRRLETSWNGLKVGVRLRTGRRSRSLFSECKKKKFQVLLLNRSDTVAVCLLRHRQDSNLRRHCLEDTLSYGLKPAFDSEGRFNRYTPYKNHLSKLTVDSACDRIIDQAPIKFTLDRNCAHTKFTRILTKESRRDHKTPRRSAPSVDTTERETSWL